jgi:hypothetical protein
MGNNDKLGQEGLNTKHRQPPNYQLIKDSLCH